MWEKKNKRTYLLEITTLQKPFKIPWVVYQRKFGDAWEIPCKRKNADVQVLGDWLVWVSMTFLLYFSPRWSERPGNMGHNHGVQAKGPRGDKYPLYCPTATWKDLNTQRKRK
jgi:hypothetical protein